MRNREKNREPNNSTQTKCFYTFGVFTKVHFIYLFYV